MQKINYPNHTIKIDFDSEKESFFLSALIFCSPTDLPLSIRNYIEAREGVSFEPYNTKYILEGFCVYLVQELPFQWGYQPSFREQLHGFKKTQAHCSQILLEIALEERLAQAEHLFQ